MFFQNQKRRNAQAEATVSQMTIEEINAMLQCGNHGATHEVGSSIAVTVTLHKEEKPVIKNKKDMISKARIKSQMEMI